MTEQRAIEAMRAFIPKGYTVQLTGRGPHSHDANESYSVAIVDLRFDAIDLRAVCDAAEGIGMTVTMHAIESGKLRIHEVDPTPAAIRSPRRHPR